MECPTIQHIWRQLLTYLITKSIHVHLTKQIALLGYFHNNKHSNIINNNKHSNIINNNKHSNIINNNKHTSIINNILIIMLKIFIFA